MGESSAATVKEIEEIRERLETNFEELERRMPAPAIWGKRLVGMAVGGGIGALVLRQVLKRAAKAPIEKAKNKAKAKVKETVAGPGPTTSGGGVPWKPLVAAGVGVWVALKLIKRNQRRPVDEGFGSRPA